MDMEAITGGAFFVFSLLGFVGWVWLVVLAFKRALGWGILVLSTPLVVGILSLTNTAGFGVQG